MKWTTLIMACWAMQATLWLEASATATSAASVRLIPGLSYYVKVESLTRGEQFVNVTMTSAGTAYQVVPYQMNTSAPLASALLSYSLTRGVVGKERRPCDGFWGDLGLLCDIYRIFMGEWVDIYGPLVSAVEMGHAYEVKAELPYAVIRVVYPGGSAVVHTILGAAHVGLNGFGFSASYDEPGVSQPAGAVACHVVSGADSDCYAISASLGDECASPGVDYQHAASCGASWTLTDSDPDALTIIQEGRTYGTQRNAAAMRLNITFDGTIASADPVTVQTVTAPIACNCTTGWSAYVCAQTCTTGGLVAVTDGTNSMYGSCQGNRVYIPLDNWDASLGTGTCTDYYGSGERNPWFTPDTYTDANGNIPGSFAFNANGSRGAYGDTSPPNGGSCPFPYFQCAAEHALEVALFVIALCAGGVGLFLLIFCCVRARRVKATELSLVPNTAANDRGFQMMLLGMGDTEYAIIHDAPANTTCYAYWNGTYHMWHQFNAEDARFTQQLIRADRLCCIGLFGRHCTERTVSHMLHHLRQCTPLGMGLNCPLAGTSHPMTVALNNGNVFEHLALAPLWIVFAVLLALVLALIVALLHFFLRRKSAQYRKFIAQIALRVHKRVEARYAISRAQRQLDDFNGVPHNASVVE